MTSINDVQRGRKSVTTRAKFFLWQPSLVATLTGRHVVTSKNAPGVFLWLTVYVGLAARICIQ